MRNVRTHKICSMCKQVLPATKKYFYRVTTNPYDEWHNYCKVCISERHQMRKYGLTKAQREAMYASQDGRCAICGEHKSFSKISTDHNHVTGKVRGLLCTFCNTLVGYLEKRPGNVKQAEEYMGGWRDE